MENPDAVGSPETRPGIRPDTRPDSASSKLYSVIGPAKDEAGNVAEFVAKCLAGFEAAGVRGEVILVDDGSEDGTREEIRKAVVRHPDSVRGFAHRRNEGLSQALKTGFYNAKGDYLLWISPDLEADPVELIPKFVSKFGEGYDVVSSYRTARGDNKDIASWIYNKITNVIFGMSYRDKNWVKGFHRKCLPHVNLRADWHRFILVMLHQAGFRIVEVESSWAKRSYGKSKFGLMRFPKSFIDSISIWFVTTFRQKPMRFFGVTGGILGIGGGLIHLGLLRLYLANQTQIRPLFWFAIACEIMGIMLVLFGFLAELVISVEDRIEQLERGRLGDSAWWDEIR